MLTADSLVSLSCAFFQLDLLFFSLSVLRFVCFFCHCVVVVVNGGDSYVIVVLRGNLTTGPTSLAFRLNVLASLHFARLSVVLVECRSCFAFISCNCQI